MQMRSRSPFGVVSDNAPLFRQSFSAWDKAHLSLILLPHTLCRASCVGADHVTAKRVKESCVVRIYGISPCPNEEESTGTLVVMAINIFLPFDRILTLILKRSTIWCF